MNVQEIDTLVIGAGQSGLAVGYYLQNTKRTFVIVDSNTEIGSAWMSRWDSLRLFTPRRLSGLPGMKLPKTTHTYPSRYDIVAYLKRYVQHFRIPVQLDTQVVALERKNAMYHAQTNRGRIVAKNVVVATGPYMEPHIPDAAQKLSKKIKQLHSSQYKNPSQFSTERVVVVGGGNSGAQIALELARTKTVAIITAGTPQYIQSRIVGISVFQLLRIVGLMKAKTRTLFGKKLKEKSSVIVGTELRRQIKTAHIRHFPTPVIGSTTNTLKLTDGTKIPVDAVLWATGYKPNYSWIRIPGVLNEKGEPLHENGISMVDGCFWVGLPWQSHLSSALLYGVGRDAKYIVSQLT